MRPLLELLGPEIEASGRATLAINILSPTHHTAIGFQTTGVLLPRAYRLDRSSGRAALAGFIISPTHDTAIGFQTTGVIVPRA